MRLPLVIAPGLDTDDTRTAAKGTFADADRIRFYDGRAQTKGGFENMIRPLLNGVCRNVLSFPGVTGSLFTAFGTHAALQVVRSGGLHDITPAYAQASVILGSNSLVASVGSHVVIIGQPLHGYTTGLSIQISGAQQVGGLVPNGVFSLTVIDPNTYSITFGAAAAATALTANPLTTVNASPLVNVHQVAHGLTDGAFVTVAGAAAVGGITPNGTFAISVVDADHYTFVFTSPATSGATGGGAGVTTFAAIAGGNNVLIQPQPAFQAGNIDGVGGAGFGTGSYGRGLYGAASAIISYLRTWSLSAFGGTLMASPRGGPIYWWQGDVSVRAAPLANGPAEVRSMIVPPNRRQVMALGCTGIDGVYDAALIRWTSLGDPTTWAPPDGTVDSATSTAGFDKLEGGGEIVGGRAIGDSLVIWTDAALYRGDFTGDVSQLWAFTKIAEHCGLMGPNAAVVTSQTARWLSPSGQFWSYTLGGAPAQIVCPIQKDFIDNLAKVQQDKVVASSMSAGFAEVRFDYPDGRDGFENSRFLLLNSPPSQGLISTPAQWSRGIEARSALVDAGPAPYPIAVSPSGKVYYQDKSNTADGGALTFSIETADLVLGADPVMVREFWPDFQDQVGPVSITFIARDHPQGSERSYGPYICVPGQSRVQVRFTTRVLRLRVSSVGSPSFWRLGQWELEASPAGKLGRR